MRLHNLTFVLLFISIMITGNAQDVHIAGGGTLMDWANLKFYQESNEDLKKLNDPNRVVFMGNSITQQWSVFNKDFFSNNPFVNRGIGGQTSPQMLVRFKPDAEIATANGITVYICSTLPAIDFLWSPGLKPAAKVIKLNNILKKYCIEKGITYVDYYTSMVDSEGGLKVPEYTAANDLVHPNLAGYKVMEKIILTHLK
jgi:hypothetical protein